MCVERPTPSVPSTTINLPGYSSCSTPGSGVPYECVELISFAPTLLVKVLADQQAHLALLALDRAARVDHRQPKLCHHAIVFFENLALEDLETVFGIVRPAEVHTRFVIF